MDRKADDVFSLLGDSAGNAAEKPGRERPGGGRH